MKKSLTLFLLVAMFGSVVVSQAEAANPLRIIVTVVIASNEGHDFNLDNDEYRDQLLNLFSYTSYQQLDQQYVVDLEKGGPQTLALPDDYELMLDLLSEEGDRSILGAYFRTEKMQYLATELSILTPGVVFLGGPRSSEGDLVLVIEAVD